MTNRTLKQNFGLSLRGIAMGAADVVPGVSGGTIAFITGIYDELIDSLNRINLSAFNILIKQGVRPFWSHVNGTFFLFLLSGIFISILSLAKLITYLIDNEPIPVWSFFFGLIIASVLLVIKAIEKWNLGTYAFLAAGIIIAYGITLAGTSSSSTSLMYIFISGAIAICAMILPGISGSFILVIMGSYHVVLDAVKSFDVAVIAVFGTGCVIGLLSFSKLLKYLLAKQRDFTIAMLIGFMIGSLNKVWPWKINVGAEPVIVHSNGREEWLTQNTSPFMVEDPQLGAAIFFFMLGLGIILLITLIQKKVSA